MCNDDGAAGTRGTNRIGPRRVEEEEEEPGSARGQAKRTHNASRAIDPALPLRLALPSSSASVTSFSSLPCAERCFVLCRAASSPGSKPFERRLPPLEQHPSSILPYGTYVQRSLYVPNTVPEIRNLRESSLIPSSPRRVIESLRKIN